LDPVDGAHLGAGSRAEGQQEEVGDLVRVRVRAGVRVRVRVRVRARARARARAGARGSRKRWRPG